MIVPTPSRPLPAPRLDRRSLLQVGSSGLLGLGLADCLRGSPRDQATAASPKQVIVVFLTGAASHHDTFD
ncbi:MAG: DUF1501 domain-containing protein, partial [Planctomycetaceae bacterium]